MVTPKQHSGFTIIELMIAVAVVGILTMLALPSMKDSILTQRVKAAANEAHISLLLARSEAIKRNANIDINRTGTTWDLGWTVVTQAGGTVLNTTPALQGVTIACNTDADPTSAADACPSKITFGRTGRPTSLLEYRIYVPGNNRVFMRCVRISLGGQPHVDVDTDGNPANGCQS